MRQVPMHYRFTALLVRGRAFVAEVEMSGWAVADHGGGEVALYCVEADGACERGADLCGAFEGLRRHLREALFAIAAASGSFAEFAAAVEARLSRTSDGASERFRGALARLAPGDPSDAATLAEPAASIVVRELREVGAGAPPDNRVDALVALDRRELEGAPRDCQERRVNG